MSRRTRQFEKPAPPGWIPKIGDMVYLPCGGVGNRFEGRR